MRPGPKPNLCGDINCPCQMRSSPTAQSWRLGGQGNEIGDDDVRRRERAARYRREARARGKS